MNEEQKKEIILEANGIEKSFGALHILKGISLRVCKGEIVTIVGASGAGKTTLLQILGTLDNADSGNITIADEMVSSLSANKQADFRNRHIGFVFQFHQLLPEFTAQENVAIPALIAGKSKHEAMLAASELLTTLNLSERLTHKPAALSGGEKQRVAVARALINEPYIIFADEPSGALDTQHKQELHKLFLDLRDRLGITFIIVTHDDTLSAIADRVIPLKDGIVVAPNNL